MVGGGGGGEWGGGGSAWLLVETAVCSSVDSRQFPSSTVCLSSCSSFAYWFIWTYIKSRFPVAAFQFVVQIIHAFKSPQTPSSMAAGRSWKWPSRSWVWFKEGWRRNTGMSIVIISPICLNYMQSKSVPWRQRRIKQRNRIAAWEISAAPLGNDISEERQTFQQVPEAASYM